MKKPIIYIAVLLLILFDLNLKAQTDTEFWFVNPEISTNHGDDPVIFVFTTREFAADVTIEMPAEPAFIPVTLSIPAYTTDFLPIAQADPEFAIIENTTVMDELSLPVGSRDNIGNKAILITSTAPINVYFTQDRENNSDIYALKGGNGIGTEFIIPFQEHGYNRQDAYAERAFSSVEIISFEDGTVVEITPPAGRDVYRSGTFPNQLATYSVTIDRGEVYTLPPGWDPTVVHGAFTGWWAVDGIQHLGGLIIKVTSGPGVAVVKKDDSVRLGVSNGGSGGWDIIADQWVPYKGVVDEDNDILGTEYVAMRGNLNNGWEWVYVAAPENGTRIWVGNSIDTTVAPVDFTLDRGEQQGIQFNTGVYTVGAFDFMEMISNKPLSVLHVSGDGTEMGGAVLPPISKCTGSTSVTIARSVWWPVWLNIMVRNGAENDFLFEGVVQDGVGTLIDPATFVPVGSTGEWLATQVIVPANDFSDFPIGAARTISNTEDVFHLGVIHGGGPGCRFGYFSDFNELKVSANTIQGDGSQPSSTIRACKGDTVQLYATGGSVFNWWPATNLSSTTISNPTAVVDDFRTYFVEVSGACNNKDTATVTIEMAEQPDAMLFMEYGQGCARLNMEIRNLSTDVNQIYFDYNVTGIGGVVDRDTIKYHPSVIRDVDTVFTHSFFNTSFEPLDSPEVYHVQLKVKATKCIDTINTTVTVYPEVTADFTLSDLNDTLSCNPAVVEFFAVDSSINEDYYKWNFGDGALSATGDTTHEYHNIHTDQDTTYTARLVVRSDWFCRDTAYQDFTIHPYLEGGFTIDKDKGCSPFNVAIENLSSGADSIFLNYGDGDIDTLLSFSSINHFYQNNDGIDEVDTNIIVMRVKNDEGCEFTDRDTILVYPEFIADYNIDGPGNYEGCNSRTVTFTNITDDGTHLASRYLWEFDDGTSMDTTNNTINKLYNNTTTGDKTYNFRLTARSIYGCTDDTTNSIDIYRAYANFTVDNNEGCSPVEVRVTNISIGNQITNWDWDYGDGHLDTDKDPFPYTYTNTSAANITNKLVLEVTGTNGCSTRDSVDIVVYPQIKANYTTALTSVLSCDSLIAVFNSNIINSGLAATTVYTWDFGDGASSSDADPTHVYKNLSSATLITRRVDLHVETPLGCSYDTSSFIDVYPLVNANISIDQATGCSPLTVDAVATEYIGIDSYDWDYDDGIGSYIGYNPGQYTYPVNPPGDNDVYTLRLDVSDLTGTCTDFDTKTITVYDEALADFVPKNSTDCDPYEVTFDNLSQNSATYKWDFDDGGTTSTDFEPTYEFTNNTSATKPFNVELEVTSDEGCTNTFTSAVNVLPVIEADFDIDVSEGCSPLTVTISNNYVGSQCYWYWDKDDNVVNIGAADSTVNFVNFNKTYINNSGTTRTDSLTLIVGNANGCYEMFKRAITVHSTIDAQFTMVPASGEGCNTLPVDFTNATINGNTYNWSFGDGSSTTIESPSHEFINTTTNDKPFTVRMDAESVNGCTDHFETVITVYSKVIADFSIATSEGCPPFSTSIDNTSIGNAANTYQWLIDNVPVGGAPTNMDDFDHTYENLVNSIRDYEVKLIATNNPHGCTSEHIDTVTVYEYVEASYSMDIDNGCTPLNIVFTDLSYVPASTKYTWSFGDGASSGLSDPVHTFYNPSRTADFTYTIDLTVQSPNYCYDDTSMDVEVFHQPLATMYVPTTTSCPPLEAYMDNFNSKGYDSFEWRFGDENPNNTVDSSLVHSYTSLPDAVKYYDLILWVGTNEGCTHTDSIRLSVFPDVIADFTYDVAGCSPFTSTFINETSATAEFFSWNFDDGTTSSQQHPIHRFENTTNVDKVYDVRLFARNEYECSDDTIQPVTVYAQPTAQFNPTPAVQTYPEATVWLNSTSNNEPWDYLWEFGDINGTTSDDSNQILFEYPHWGEKDIKLTLTSKTSDCSDNLTRSVIIYPPEVNAAFTTDIDGGCLNEGLEVQFTAAGSAYAEVYSYTWDFGDGETGTGANIYHTYEVAGVFYVKMTASSNEGAGEDFEYKTIRVYSNPDANFEVSPKLVMLNTDLEARVEFFNMSECNDTAGCAYVWHFGDGNTSISRDVTHNYSPDPDDIPIKYDISLYVTTAHACTDSLILLEEVEIIGAGEIKFPNAFTPNGDGLNDTFRPVSEGVIEYELLVYNRWGELIFTTKDLSAGWDGKVKSEYAKPDVYVWKAQGKFTNGRSFELAGDVTLIR